MHITVFYQSFDLSNRTDNFSELLMTGIGEHTLILQRWNKGDCRESYSINSKNSSIIEAIVQHFCYPGEIHILVDSIYLSRFEDNLRHFPNHYKYLSEDDFIEVLPFATELNDDEDYRDYFDI